jgi:glutamate 5-kinase
VSADPDPVHATASSQTGSHFYQRCSKQLACARIVLRTLGTEMPSRVPSLDQFRRIVVKVGSSLLVDSGAGRLKEAWLASLADDIAELHQQGRDMLVVSSGAIALGRAVLRIGGGPIKLEDSQASAAVGQIALARTWSEVLGQHGLTAGQVLVTLQDTEERRRYLNARSTIAKLLEWRAVPVINENDTVATNEIRYGDNDRLAARVATMASADLLILLSDVDGLYDAPPADNAHARLIPLVERITPAVEAVAGAAGSHLSRGGMMTKIEAAKIATQGGTHMVIASGRVPHPLRTIAQQARCTWFLTGATPVTARKKWIGGTLEPKGSLVIDSGAVAALRRGKSLLPAGVIRVDGVFARGDAVVIRGPDGTEIGRGLVAYDAEDAAKIRGRSSADIVSILGFGGRAAMIHRDDLILGRD